MPVCLRDSVKASHAISARARDGGRGLYRLYQPGQYLLHASESIRRQVWLKGHLFFFHFMKAMRWHSKMSGLYSNFYI